MSPTSGSGTGIAHRRIHRAAATGRIWSRARIAAARLDSGGPLAGAPPAARPSRSARRRPWVHTARRTPIRSLPRRPISSRRPPGQRHGQLSRAPRRRGWGPAWRTSTRPSPYRTSLRRYRWRGRCRPRRAGRVAHGGRRSTDTPPIERLSREGALGCCRSEVRELSVSSEWTLLDPAAQSWPALAQQEDPHDH